MFGRNVDFRDALLDVTFKPALFRSFPETELKGRENCLTEAAGLYGLSTMRYSSSLDNSEINSSKVLGQIYCELEAREVHLFSKILTKNIAKNTKDVPSEESEKMLTPMDTTLNTCTVILTEVELLHNDALKNKVRFTIPGRFSSQQAVDLAWIVAIVSVCTHQVTLQAGGRKKTGTIFTN